MADERRLTLQLDSAPGMNEADSHPKMARDKQGLKMACNDFQNIVDNLRITIFGKKEKQIFTPQKKYKMIIDNNAVEDQVSKLESAFYKVVKDLYWSKYEFFFPRKVNKMKDKHGLNRSTTIDSDDINYVRDDFLRNRLNLQNLSFEQREKTF